MGTSEPAPSTETPLSQDIIHALRYYLGGRRGWLLLGGVAALAGLALNWSWLVAIGVAPLLIAFLPCVAMCALGLCMSRMAGNSDASRCEAPSNPETPRDVGISDEPATEAADPKTIGSPVEEPDFAPAAADDELPSEFHAETTEERS